MKVHKFALFASAVTLLTGCEPAESVEVQPLPPAERPSPEARLGLPEVAGSWRFAGWELARNDSAGLAGNLPSLGRIEVRTQRLDSIAGIYVLGGSGAPFVGEVRRDSVFSLVTLAGAGSYVAGEVSGDTLWMSMTSIVPSEVWPNGARAAFVRGQAGPVFARLEGAIPPPAVAFADSMARDTAREPSFRPVSPGPVAESRTGTEQAPPAIAVEPQAPPVPTPDMVAPPVDIPEPDLPDLLGTPVVRDTTGIRS